MFLELEQVRLPESIMEIAGRLVSAIAVPLAADTPIPNEIATLINRILTLLFIFPVNLSCPVNLF